MQSRFPLDRVVSRNLVADLRINDDTCSNLRGHEFWLAPSAPYNEPIMADTRASYTVQKLTILLELHAVSFFEKLSSVRY